MMRTILVPLDGSPASEQALPHACRLARTTGAGLLLVRAAPHAPVPGAPASELRETVRDAEAYLAPIQQRLQHDGYTVATMALHADPLRAIRYAAGRAEADAIVMSTHARSGVGRTLLGSVAEGVLQHTALPLLLVRVHEQQGPTEPDPYRTVLLPLDGTAFAEAALAYVARGELGRDLEVILLRALPPAAPILVPGLAHYAIDRAYAAERGQEAALQYLAMTADAQLRGWTYRNQVTGAQPAAAICAVAEAQDADLIVMATHARTGLERLAIGRVAERVLRHAHVPVLLLHGAEAAAHRAAPAVAAAEIAASTNR